MKNEDLNNMSKDRLKEEIEGIKLKKNGFLVGALFFLLPSLFNLVGFVIGFLMGGTFSPGYEIYLVLTIAVVIIGLVFGKIHLNYKSKYNEMKEML